MKVTYGKTASTSKSLTTYVRDAHPLQCGGEWRLVLKSGETVNPLLYCGLNAAGQPVYAMQKTDAHPEGDPAWPSITSVSLIAKNGRGRRTVHAPEFTTEVKLHVEAVKAAFRDTKEGPAFIANTLEGIAAQEVLRLAALALVKVAEDKAAADVAALVAAGVKAQLI